MGGWNINKYWDMFEPDHFTLYKDAKIHFCFSRDALAKKHSTFLHMNRYTISDLIKKAKEVNGIEEQKKLIGKLLTERIDFLHGTLVGKGK